MQTNARERSGKRVAAVLLGLGRAVSAWSRESQMTPDQEALLSRYTGGRV